MGTAPIQKTVWDDARLADPHGQGDKSARVRAMFDAIAPTYERVNRVMSAGRDAYWRRTAVEMAGIKADDRVLDLACGTGDFARAFASARPACVIGCDFSEKMLALAIGRGTQTIDWLRTDAIRLPFVDESFTVTSCAFGIRNLQSAAAGLGEMFRVLRPGGRAVILEFSMPRAPLLGALYRFYFRRILPRAAKWISGDRTGAYDYLPRSVDSFMDAGALVDALRSAGFSRIEHRSLSIGIVMVCVAWKDR